MSVSISVENSRKYTKESWILIGAGAVSGVVASGLHLIAGSAHAALTSLAFGAIVGLSVNLSDPREDTPMLRLVLSMIAGALIAGLLSVHWALAAVVGGALFGLAFTIGDASTKVERAFFTGVYGLALLGAMFVTIVASQEIDQPFVLTVFTTTTWGLFLAFAAGLKRVKWSRDEVVAEFNDAYADLRGEDRETIRSGQTLYNQIVSELERDGDARHVTRGMQIATETSRALIALTRRAQQLREGVQITSKRDLNERIVALDERIAATSDATVKRELQVTLEQLVAQVNVRRRFDVARARIESRQQRCFTALERLHIALVQSGAGDSDAAVIESIESLEQLSDEIQWRNLSVDELTSDEVEPPADADHDAIVAELREQAAAAAVAEQASASQEEVELIIEPHQPATLDTVGLKRHAGTDEPPGTDGSINSPEEQVTNARANSR